MAAAAKCYSIHLQCQYQTLFTTLKPIESRGSCSADQRAVGQVQTVSLTSCKSPFIPSFLRKEGKRHQRSVYFFSWLQLNSNHSQKGIMPLTGELVLILIYTRQRWDPPSPGRPSVSGWGLLNNQVISVWFSSELHVYIRVTGEGMVLHKTSSLHGCVLWGDWVNHPKRFSGEEPSKDPFYKKILFTGAGLLAQPQTSGKSVKTYN